MNKSRATFSLTGVSISDEFQLLLNAHEECKDLSLVDSIVHKNNLIAPLILEDLAAESPPPLPLPLETVHT